MATTTNKTNALTNLEALTMATELAKDAGKEELATKLAHMADVALKAKDRKTGTKAPSKATLELERLAREVAGKLLEYGKPAGTLWVIDNTPFVTTSQKATSVMRKAMQLGLVEKAEPVKGKVQYKAIAPKTE